jgi:hypothetical protein
VHIVGPAAIANAIKDMEALSKFDISQNCLYAAGAKAISEGLKGNQVMTELNLAGNDMGIVSPGKFAKSDMSGVTALADVIPDMRALMSLHVGANNIPEKDIREIMAIAMRMNSMKILCEVPFKDKTLTELGISGKNLGTEGALVVAGYLVGSEALLTLIFGGDKVNRWDATAQEPATLKVGMTEADFSSKNLGPAGAIIISAWISHKDKGALTSLNLSSNRLTNGTDISGTMLNPPT